MDASLAPFVDVQVAWAVNHVWKPRSIPQTGPIANNLWLMLRGTAQMTAAGQAWDLEPGTALLLTPLHQRAWFESEDWSQSLSIGFSATLFGQFDLLQSLEKPAAWRPVPDEFPPLEDLALGLTKAWCHYDYSNLPLDGNARLLVQGLTQAVFSTLWRQLEAGGKVKVPAQQAAAWLPNALDHLKREPSTSVASWGRAVGFSPAQFRRVFAAQLGATPHEYLTRHRLNQARRLLRSTDMTIGAITERAGFGSLSHFTQLFKTTYGASPGVFRRQPADDEPF